MSVFKDFERVLLHRLACPALSADLVESIVEEAERISYEPTGVGYFWTVRHPKLPSERMVFDDPLLFGRFKGVEAGFIIFIEDGELTIECHGWGESVPESFREQNVEVSECARARDA